MQWGKNFSKIVVMLDRRGKMEPGGLEEQWCQEGSKLRYAVWTLVVGVVFY